MSFAFVTAFTPGPNNIMLTASAANIGSMRLTQCWASRWALAVCSRCSRGALLVASAGSASQGRRRCLHAVAGLEGRVMQARMEDDGGRCAAADVSQAAALQWGQSKGVIIAARRRLPPNIRPDERLVPRHPLAVLDELTLASTVAWSSFGVALQGAARRAFYRMALLLAASIIPMVVSLGQLELRHESTCRMCTSVLEQARQDERE